MLLLLMAAFLQGAAATPSTMKTVDKGGMSAIEAQRQVTARTPEEFATLWKAHARDRKMPEVDFSNSMVVGIFLGSRPTGGYSVEIVSAQPEGNTLVVKYKESRPGRGTMTTQVLTAPFHLVAIPKFDGQVRFEKLP